jgi:hypothetical protein
MYMIWLYCYKLNYFMDFNKYQNNVSKPRKFAFDDFIILQPPSEELIRLRVIINL